MKTFNTPFLNNKIILALGAESAGNFSVFNQKKIYFSKNFGNLLEENNWKNFQKEISNFLQKEKTKPTIIISDLHPLYKTTQWGSFLAQKNKAYFFQVQHHLAHIFSAWGEQIIFQQNFQSSYPCSGVALDGTGYGIDKKIWGGEIFIIKKPLPHEIKRVGHLENQTLLGGELAIKKPARMLMAILNNFLAKKELYLYLQKYYSPNQFELLYNQLQENFNCLKTSSSGRILDAVSILLSLAGNERKYKHEAADILEKNSTKPYILKPKITTDKSLKILNTTYLFEYLIKNISQDKKRLAATTQLYLAKGLREIIPTPQFFLAGGITNNKIIADYLIKHGGLANKKIPRGDAGLSFGQIIFYLLTNSRN